MWCFPIKPTQNVSLLLWSVSNVFQTICTVYRFFEIERTHTIYGSIFFLQPFQGLGEMFERPTPNWTAVRDALSKVLLLLVLMAFITSCPSRHMFCRKISQKTPENEHFAPEHGWLDYRNFLFGAKRPMFRGGFPFFFREGKIALEYLTSSYIWKRWRKESNPYTLKLTFKNNPSTYSPKESYPVILRILGSLAPHLLGKYIIPGSSALPIA